MVQVAKGGLRSAVASGGTFKSVYLLPTKKGIVTGDVLLAEYTVS
jgi:hypothetical protein